MEGLRGRREALASTRVTVRVRAKRHMSAARPLIYLDRRGVRSFRRVFGPRYPPYLGLACLFGFFSLLGFYVLQSEFLGPIPMLVSAAGGIGLGLVPYFADDSLLPIPADATPAELLAFRHRVRLASLLLVLGGLGVLASYDVLGTAFFLSVGTFFFVGIVFYSLLIFATTQALACYGCDAVTLFRSYRGRTVCTRCGSGPSL